MQITIISNTVQKFSTDVVFQSPYSYRRLWLIIAICLLAIVLIAQIITRLLLRNKTKKVKPIKIVAPPPETLEDIKKRYFQKITELEQSVRLNEYTLRESYLTLSLIIREFVHETTGIEVQKYTLSDIDRLQIPPLTYLVSEYYEPEFAKESNANILASMRKQKQQLYNGDTMFKYQLVLYIGIPLVYLFFF